MIEEEFFNDELKYTNAATDKLAIFDGNIVVGPVVNPKYGIKTMIAFRRFSRPSDKSIGDLDDLKSVDVEGYAFHFEQPESVQVVIDALKEIKKDMVNNKDLTTNHKRGGCE